MEERREKEIGTLKKKKKKEKQKEIKIPVIISQFSVPVGISKEKNLDKKK